jgi:hypothetical protein
MGNSMGTRHSADTLIKNLKKEEMTEYVNKDYCESPENVTNRVETDETGSLSR